MDCSSPSRLFSSPSRLHFGIGTFLLRQQSLVNGKGSSVQVVLKSLFEQVAGTSKKSNDAVSSEQSGGQISRVEVVSKGGLLGNSHSLDVLNWPPTSVRLASVTFHWPLAYVSKLLEEQCISEIFTAAGFRWRLKFSPKGPSRGKNTTECFASFFLESIDAGEGNGPHATFELGVINQDFNEQSFWRACQHAFTKKVADWGFSKFIALDDLIDAKRGFIVDDRLILAIRF